MVHQFEIDTNSPKACPRLAVMEICINLISMLDSAARKIYVKFLHQAGAYNLQQPDFFRLHRYYSMITPIS